MLLTYTCAYSCYTYFLLFSFVVSRCIFSLTSSFSPPTVPPFSPLPGAASRRLYTMYECMPELGSRWMGRSSCRNRWYIARVAESVKKKRVKVLYDKATANNTSEEEIRRKGHTIYTNNRSKTHTRSPTIHT